MASREDIEACRTFTHQFPLLQSPARTTRTSSSSPSIPMVPSVPSTSSLMTSSVHFKPANAKETLASAILTNSTRPLVTATPIMSPVTSPQTLLGTPIASAASENLEVEPMPHLPAVKANSYSGPSQHVPIETGPAPPTPEDPLQVLVVDDDPM